jgi:hypothetical protein
MARIKYDSEIVPLINKHYGYTFQPGRYGQVMMRSQPQARARYPRQFKRMHSIQEAINAWRQFSGTEISNWESFVASLPQNCHNPDSGVLTAYQNFLKRQQYNFLFDGPDAEIISSPSVTEIIQDPVELSIRNSGTELFIDYEFTEWTEDNIVALYVSFPTSPGKLYQRTQTRFIGYIINFLPLQINYGSLYNWYCIGDARNIAPPGWHTLSLTDASWLINELGGTSLAGGAMKETGLDWWASPNAGATNLSGLSRRGSGRRDDNGQFNSFRLYQGNYINHNYISGGAIFSSNRSNANSQIGQVYHQHGHSFLLQKDDDNLAPCVGNDGTIYNTVKINNRVFLAEHSIETKFQNGDDIPYITSNLDWAALTSPGMCYYNNNQALSFSQSSLPLSLNITELFKYNFGIIPEPGQSVFLRAIPMGLTNGQFFEQTFLNLVVQ